ATYTAGEWSGDVASLDVGTGSIGTAPVWSAAEWANENASDFLSRGVFTWRDGGRTFPTDAQRNDLARTTGQTQVTGVANAAYIKGDRSDEGTTQGKLRKRTSPIGDIVNSSPFFVKESDSLYIGANDGMLH